MMSGQGPPYALGNDCYWLRYYRREVSCGCLNLAHCCCLCIDLQSKPGIGTGWKESENCFELPLLCVLHHWTRNEIYVWSGRLSHEGHGAMTDCKRCKWSDSYCSNIMMMIKKKKDSLVSGLALLLSVEEKEDIRVYLFFEHDFFLKRTCHQPKK